TLLLVRLRGGAVAWLSARAVGGRATTWPAFLLASAGRRGSAINRGLVIVGLLLAFGVELGLFTATYDQQARADAQLTLGADVVGIVQEFPSAPRDSFMVVNIRYLEQVTHDPGPNAYFVRTNGDPVGVAGRLAAATRSFGTTVRDIRQQTAQTVSSITTVDLS